MYGREQLESDLLWLDSQRAEGARMLIAGTINGFDKLNLDTEIDRAEQSCRGKLAGVRMAIGDRKAMIRSGKIRYWKRSKGKLIVKAHGKESPWRPTTEAELQALRAAGYYVIELKSFPPQGGVASEQLDAAPPLPNAQPVKREVTLEEAQILALEGIETIIWRPEGRECAQVVIYG